MIKLLHFVFILLCFCWTLSPRDGQAAPENSLTLPPADFWEFPGDVEPAAQSGLWYSGTTAELEYVRTAGFRLSWAEMNPQEGVYDFSLLERYLARAEAEDFSIVVRLACSVVDRKSPFPYGDRQAPFVPDWVVKKHNPAQFKTFENTATGHYITVAAPWDENLQNEFRLFIAEFGSRGFFANQRLAGVYLHGISSSFGEEFWLKNEFVANAQQAGMTTDNLMKAFKDRIDWWSSAAKAHRNKVAWVSCGRIGDSGFDSDALNQYALEAGLGLREGGMEYYHRNLPPHMGQTYQDDGYVSVDWSAPVRDGQRYFGEEIENRLQDLHPGITDQEQGYFTQSSLMRAAQLGMNYLWASKKVINSSPEMFRWWTLIAGKDAQKAPDAICWLREDYYYLDRILPWKNLEHFVYQRDLPGAMTKPVMQIDRPEFFADPADMHYDYTARSTDKKNGSDSMLFLFDDTFRQNLNGKFELKVFYFDDTINTWHLEIPTASDVFFAGEVTGRNDKQWKTATFVVSSLHVERPPNTNCDFRLKVNSGGDLSVRYVRAVKTIQKDHVSPPSGLRINKNEN